MMIWKLSSLLPLMEEAGKIALDYRGRAEALFKADQTLVTRADREIEDLFFRSLNNPREGVFFLGEETIEDRGEE